MREPMDQSVTPACSDSHTPFHWVNNTVQKTGIYSLACSLSLPQGSSRSPCNNKTPGEKMWKRSGTPAKPPISVQLFQRACLGATAYYFENKASNATQSKRQSISSVSTGSTKQTGGSCSKKKCLSHPRHQVLKGTHAGSRSGGISAFVTLPHWRVDHFLNRLIAFAFLSSAAHSQGFWGTQTGNVANCYKGCYMVSELCSWVRQMLFKIRHAKH